MDKQDFVLDQIGIVMLSVHDVELSLALYRDKLGLKLQNQFPGFAFLQAGTVTLCLSQAAFQSRGQGAGAGEVGFAVEGVKAAYDALKEKGVQFTHEPRAVSPTTWVANFDDPDGNHLFIFGSQP